MNMATKDLKQKEENKKTRISVKFHVVYKDYLPTDVNSWRPLRRVISFCAAFMVSIIPPRFNLKSVSAHKQIHPAFPGKIGNCIHIKCHSSNVYILKQVLK